MVVESERSVNQVAALTNVSVCMTALERAMKRPAHLPGLVAFYGPSGWGKSMAATFAANRHRAYHVQAKSVWTRKAMLSAVLTDMGIVPARTIYQMVDQIAEQLVLSGRPLIIDEMDHVIDRGLTEVVRDLYEASNAPILLIGEERMPLKIKQVSERFDGRILGFYPAEPLAWSDAQKLARFYTGDLVGEDLLKKFFDAVKGSARRLCVNLTDAEQLGRAHGLERVGVKEWGDRLIATGDAPRRRV